MKPNPTVQTALPDDGVNDKDWRRPYRELITDCLAHRARLNDWESDFIDSVATQLDDNKRILSAKQIQWLDKIHHKVTRT